jgi:hypothetical protein
LHPQDGRVKGDASVFVCCCQDEVVKVIDQWYPCEPL